MIQKVEIEVDVPDGWRPTGDFEYAVPYEGAEPAIIGRLILEKVEPKRESRWLNVYPENEYDTYGGASRRYGSHRTGVIRLDYEDGKLVAVTLDPEGEA